MNLSFRQCEYLVALDRHRHYGRAADALSISQPALSRSIQTIEQQVGTNLFDRSRAGAAPNASGEIVIRHAKRVLATASSLQSELAEATGRAAQRLSIACGHYPAELSVPGALGRLMQKYPQLQLAMELADWPASIEQLENDACDLAVAELSARSEQIDLGTEPLNDRPVIFVVRPGHPLTRLAAPRLEQLLAYPWASSRIPARAAERFGPGPFAAGEIMPGEGILVPRIVASSLSGSLKLAMETDAVGIAPLTVAATHLQRGELSPVRFYQPWMRLNYGFIWDRARPLPAIAQEFMAEVRSAERRTAAQEASIQRQLGMSGWPTP